MKTNTGKPISGRDSEEVIKTQTSHIENTNGSLKTVYLKR